MTATRTRFLLFGIMLIVVAAAAALTVASHAPADRQAHAEKFQRMLGGLGLGPAINLSGCPMCFDARVRFACNEDDGALPGGKFYCRHHALSVLYCPALPLKSAAIGKDDAR
jgi:hypothetical protein